MKRFEAKYKVRALVDWNCRGGDGEIPKGQGYLLVTCMKSELGWIAEEERRILMNFAWRIKVLVRL